MPEGKIRDELNNMSLREKSHRARRGKGGGKTSHVPQLEQNGGCMRVPDDDTGVVGSCGQQGPVWRELAGHHVIMMALQLTDQSILIHVPQEDLQCKRQML